MKSSMAGALIELNEGKSLDGSRMARSYTDKLSKRAGMLVWGSPPSGDVDSLAKEFVGRVKAGRRSERENGSDPVREQARGIEYDRFLDTVESLSAVRLVDPNTKEPKVRRVWYKELNPDLGHIFSEVEGQQEFYELVALVSRAAATKKDRSGNIDHLFPKAENMSQAGDVYELSTMTKSQFRMLYKFPGVKELMTEYARAEVFHENVDGLGSMAGCKDEETLKRIRGVMRDRLEARFKTQGGVYESDERRAHVAKLAEVVAYGLMFNSNLLESADTTQGVKLPAEALRRARMNAEDAAAERGEAGYTGLQIDRATGSLMRLDEGRKAPNRNTILMVGAGEMRYYMDPHSRAVEKAVGGSKHEGWGAISDLLGRLLATGRVEEAKRAIAQVYPNRVGLSFWEALEAKSGGGEEKQLLEHVLLGDEIDIDSMSENPFFGYFLGAVKRKKVYDVFVSPQLRVAETEDGRGAGRKVGQQVMVALQGAGETGDLELQRRMVLAMYHHPYKVPVQPPIYSTMGMKKLGFNMGLHEAGAGVSF